MQLVVIFIYRGNLFRNMILKLFPTLNKTEAYSLKVYSINQLAKKESETLRRFFKIDLRSYSIWNECHFLIAFRFVPFHSVWILPYCLNPSCRKASRCQRTWVQLHATSLFAFSWRIPLNASVEERQMLLKSWCILSSKLSHGINWFESKNGLGTE